MDCGTSMVKYILFVFNTLVSILGILAIVYGVIIMKSIGVIEMDNHLAFPPQAALSIGLIAIGSIVVFISFLGCCGAIREDVCMTMCYAVFMLILLILQMVLVVLLWLNKDKITEGVSNVIETAWQRNKNEPGFFDAIQTTFQCCGVNGVTDYVVNLKEPTPSCCAPNTICLPFTSYPGCEEKFRQFMLNSSDQSKYFGIGLIVVELLGFIFACCLANNVRNYKRRNAY